MWSMWTVFGASEVTSLSHFLFSALKKNIDSSHPFSVIHVKTQTEGKLHFYRANLPGAAICTVKGRSARARCYAAPSASSSSVPVNRMVPTLAVGDPGQALAPTENTGTLWNQLCQTRSESRDIGVRWTLCWRCGGGPARQRRLCRMTECRQDSPHTPLFCPRKKRRRRRRKWGKWLCYRATQSSQWYRSRPNSRTDHSFRTNTRVRFLFCWFLCKSPLYEADRSTPPPSNSGQSDHFHTAAEASGRIGLDDRGKAGPRPRATPSCCRRTVWSLGWLCLCRGWVHRHLVERTKSSIYRLFPDGLVDDDIRDLNKGVWMSYTFSGRVSTIRLHRAPP